MDNNMGNKTDTNEADEETSINQQSEDQENVTGIDLYMTGKEMGKMVRKVVDKGTENGGSEAKEETKEGKRRKVYVCKYYTLGICMLDRSGTYYVGQGRVKHPEMSQYGRRQMSLQRQVQIQLPINVQVVSREKVIFNPYCQDHSVVGTAREEQDAL